MRKQTIWMTVALLLAGGALHCAAQERAAAPTESAPKASASAAAQPVLSEAQMRSEGEQRFRNNCSRCHMAPHKFAPRIMATAVRHMRVRAMLTDEDMRYLLHYLTQ